MKRNLTLAAIAAVAIAASSLAVTTDSAFAASAPAPHYKPLACIFFPSLDACATPKAKVVVHHHKKVAPAKKPMKPTKK